MSGHRVDNRRLRNLAKPPYQQALAQASWTNGSAYSSITAAERKKKAKARVTLPKILTDDRKEVANGER